MKNCGVEAATPSVAATAAAADAGRYTFTGSAQKSTSEALPEAPGSREGYDLWSYGADGREGGEGLDADLDSRDI